VLGTSLSLSNADQLQTAISKDGTMLWIINFPLVSNDQISGLLKRKFNMVHCDIDDSKRQKLCGRVRFAASIIIHLSKSVSKQGHSKFKKDMLDHAVKKQWKWQRLIWLGANTKYWIRAWLSQTCFAVWFWGIGFCWCTVYYR